MFILTQVQNSLSYIETSFCVSELSVIGSLASIIGTLKIAALKKKNNWA